jgi:hypothetical protein
MRLSCNALAPSCTPARDSRKLKFQPKCDAAGVEEAFESKIEFGLDWFLSIQFTVIAKSCFF